MNAIINYVAGFVLDNGNEIRPHTSIYIGDKYIGMISPASDNDIITLKYCMNDCPEAFNVYSVEDVTIYRNKLDMDLAFYAVHNDKYYFFSH